MAAAFSTLYGKWIRDGRRADDRYAKAMVKKYRGVWLSGESDERICVLHFIFDRQDPVGFDLIVDGLKSLDVTLAADAAAVTWALIAQGFDLGPNVQRELESFGERFPDWKVISTAALEALAGMDE